MRSFVGAMRGEAEALTTARHCLESHLMDFAAEESRLMGTIVEMSQFRQRAESIEVQNRRGAAMWHQPHRLIPDFATV